MYQFLCRLTKLDMVTKRIGEKDEVTFEIDLACEKMISRTGD